MKKIDTFILILMSVLMLSGSSCAEPGPYNIQFDKKIHDFGVVEEGVNVNYTYLFKNTGTKPVIIRYIQPSCVCTRVLEWDRMVDPGEKGRISVTLDTPSFNGDVLKLIDVKTNIPDQQSIRLTLKGKIIIPVELVPLSAWLGEVSAETGFLKGSVEIRNNTDIPLKITAIIPPDDTITYTFTILEEDRKYRLNYVLYPPFEGREKVERQFAFKTNNKKKEYVYHKFFYYVPPAMFIHSPVLPVSINAANKSGTMVSCNLQLMDYNGMNANCRTQD